MKGIDFKKTICFLMSFLSLLCGMFTTNSPKVFSILDTSTIVQSLDKCISVVNEWVNVNEVERETIINKLSEIRDSLQFVGLQFSDDIMANNVSFLDVIVNNTNHQKDKRNSERSHLTTSEHIFSSFESKNEEKLDILINMPDINPSNEKKHEEFDSRIKGLKNFLHNTLPEIRELVNGIHELNAQKKNRLYGDLLVALNEIDRLDAEMDRRGCIAGMKTKNFRNGVICGSITTMIIMIGVVVVVVTVALSYAKKV